MNSVKLNQNAIDALNKEVNGNGGHQNLMKKLKGQYDSSNGVLKYDDNDLEKIRRYSIQYRFKAILACIDK